MKLILKRLAFFSLTALFVLSLRSSAQAQTVSPTKRPIQEFRQEVKQDIKNLRQDVREKNASRASDAKDKLRLRACQAHVKNITTRAKRIGEKAEKMYMRLDLIVVGVQKFYTDRLVPQGKTVPNYNALVADVEAKKTALKPLVEKVKTDANTFSCESSDVKGQFQTFRQDTQAAIQGFKNYRTSVRNLIVAVKSVAGTLEKRATKSAEPTVSITQ